MAHSLDQPELFDKDGFHRYIESFEPFVRLLSAEEEQELISRVRRAQPILEDLQGGRILSGTDLQVLIYAGLAYHQLIAHNLRLVVQISQSFYRSFPIGSLDDFVQEGNLGLIRCISNFNPEKGRLSTYATPWIKRYLRKFIEMNLGAYRLPNHLHIRLPEFWKFYHEFSAKHQKAPSAEDFSKTFNLRKSTSEALILSMTHSSISLNSSKFEDGDDLVHQLHSNDLLPEESFEQQENKAMAEEMLSLIENPRERQVILLLFGFDGEPRTLQSVGDLMGISRERVRRIRDKALSRIRMITGVSIDE